MPRSRTPPRTCSCGRAQAAAGDPSCIAFAFSSVAAVLLLFLRYVRRRRSLNQLSQRSSSQPLHARQAALTYSCASPMRSSLNPLRRLYPPEYAERADSAMVAAAPPLLFPPPRPTRTAVVCTTTLSSSCYTLHVHFAEPTAAGSHCRRAVRH